MKQLSVLLVTISVLFSSSITSASEEDKLYGGIVLGSNSYKDSRFDQGNSAFGFQLGWRINSLLGLEFSYIDHDEIDPRVLDQISPEPKVASISAVLRYPITKNLEVFGRVGLAQVEVDVESTNPFNVSSFNENTATYGLGIGLRLSEGWKIRVAYDRTELDLRFGSGRGLFGQSEGDLDTASVSLLFDF